MRENLKHTSTRWRLATVAICLLAGAAAYLLLLILSPLPFIPLEREDVERTLSQYGEEGAGGMRRTNVIIIPKLGIEVPLLEGDASVLEKGAWHRYPERGSPTSGGNIIVAAHRFKMGWTPGGIRAASPFYHLDTLTEGDVILMRFDQKIYAYTVKHSYHADANDKNVEDFSLQQKLTLYTCDLLNTASSRLVVEAWPETTH